jgi:hypothetical protein
MRPAAIARRREDACADVPDEGDTTLADPLALARDLVERARAGELASDARDGLAALDPAALEAALIDDARLTAFWLNVYNGAVRVRLLADPAAFRHRWRFFARAAIVVAGHRLSPNAIEHGMLRRSSPVAGLGYVRNPFPPPFERRMRVGRLDARIHFALNCGARSCPPIAAWDPATLDADLERATAAYLGTESTRTSDGGEIRVPRLLLWYRGDFGGRRGIMTLLRRHGLVGPEEEPGIRYASYDWTMDVSGPAGSP